MYCVNNKCKVNHYYFHYKLKFYINVLTLGLILYDGWILSLILLRQNIADRIRLMGSQRYIRSTLIQVRFDLILQNHQRQHQQNHLFISNFFLSIFYSVLGVRILYARIMKDTIHAILRGSHALFAGEVWYSFGDKLSP